AGGSPTEVAVPSVAQVRTPGFLETPRQIEARGELVSERLIVDKAIYVRQADGLFVETLSVELPAFDSCGLRTNQRGTISEILRAILRPYVKLSLVGGERLPIQEPRLCRCRGVKRGVRERAIKRVPGHVKK